MKDFKSGFTLSEILITLGVLGVLTILLVVAIVNLTPDSSIVMYRKANAIFSKAVSDLVNDSGNYPPNPPGQTAGGLWVARGFNSTWISGLPIPANNDKFCYLLSQKLNTTSATCTGTAGSITTTDGMVWTMTIPFTFTMSANSYEKIQVDVNGAGKPNCIEAGYTGTTCGAGVIPDKYEFQVRYDGDIKVSPLAGVMLKYPTLNRKDKILAKTTEADSAKFEATPPPPPCPLVNKVIGTLCIAPADQAYTTASEDPFMSNDNYWAGAKNACVAKGDGWRLPDINELSTILYPNKVILGGFTLGSMYWSITEYNLWQAQYVVMNAGTPGNLNKGNNSAKARCVKTIPEDACTDGVKFGSLCVAPADTTYTPISEDPFISNDNYWAGARNACAAIGQGWRMPTQVELNTLYQNKATIGGFSVFYYWSTTENGTNYAWDQGFNIGDQNFNQKDYQAKLRCVK